MSPDDWWSCVINIVASAIDKNSKEQSVRDFFVDHDGKKELEVVCGSSTIYGVDYSWLFDQFANKIAENIKKPKYVSAMTSDFTTTSAVQRIISQITVMNSLQEYFEYTMRLMCGIPAVEMMGERQDWVKLGLKLKELEAILEPINDDLGLNDWWSDVKEIFDKFVDTFDGNPDKDWWGKIISTHYRGSFSKPMTGWFLTKLLRRHNIMYLREAKSDLITVPMNIKDDSGNCEESALVAGIVGYKVHEKEGEIPAIEANHSWALMLEPNSVFRHDLVTWEKALAA